MHKQYTFPPQSELLEHWSPVGRGVQLLTREVGDEDKLMRKLVTLSSVGKVIHRL